MVSSSTAEEILNKIREDPSNSTCADCPSQVIEFASISHGSFICAACANQHMTLGPHISFVKPVSDSWSIRQLKIMTAGGNGTLQNFFSSYLMPRDSTIDFKYNTLAAKYYREMLKVMAEGESCTMPTPSIDEGLMLIQEVPIKPAEPKAEAPNPSYVGSLFGSALNFGKNLYGKVSKIETIKTIETKVIENASIVGENLKWGAQKGVEIGKGGIEWSKNKGIEKVAVVSENLIWGAQKGVEIGKGGIEWGTQKGIENVGFIGEGLKVGVQKGMEIGKESIEWGTKKGYENVQWVLNKDKE